MNKKHGVIILLFIFAMCFSACTNQQDEVFTKEFISPIEDFLESCEEISSDTLLRESETRFGEKIKIKGKIFYVEEGENSTGYLIYTKIKDYGSFSEYMDGVVLVGYQRGDEPKLLEGDVVTVYGIIVEDETYTNNNGNDVTVPCIMARKIELTN